MPRTVICTGARAAQATDHVDSGCFARAVGPEKAQNLAALNFQAEIVDGGEGTEPFGEAREFYGRFRHALSSLDIG